MNQRRLPFLLIGLATAMFATACGSVVRSDDAAADAVDASTTDVQISDASDAAITDAGDVVARDVPSDTMRRAPMFHRTDDAACRTTPPAGDCHFGGGGMCSDDSACTTGSNGRCAMSNGGVAACFCSYDVCARDSECASGQLCACHGSPFNGAIGNRCLPGNCRTDADCGSSGFCSPTHDAGCGGLGGYYCHAASDLCTDDADCPGGAGTGPQECDFVTGSARWECRPVRLCE